MTDQHRERVTVEDVARMIDEESQEGESKSGGARDFRALFFIVAMLLLLAAYSLIDWLLYLTTPEGWPF